MLRIVFASIQRDHLNVNVSLDLKVIPKSRLVFSWYRTLRPSFTFKFETDDTETPSKLITGFS